MKYRESVYVIPSEEALQEIVERLFDRELSNYAVESYSGKLFLKSYDERIDELLSSMGYEVRYVNYVDPTEWASNYVDKPFELVEGVVVDPKCDLKDKDSEKVVLHIPIGLAFGTGLHPTTRLSAGFLKETVKGGESVLDVGTGTGILAILSKKLGASKVVGVDNDPMAIEIARENAEKNGVEVEFILSNLLEKVCGIYDVVVANIVEPVLIELSKDIKKVCKNKTVVIISGIYGEGSKVFESFKRLGFDIVDVRSDEGWKGAKLLLKGS